MQVQKQKGQKKNKLQLWHPFTIFFFFLSLPAIYTSGRVLHVQPTCFHANTELPVTYAWALVASCSLKEFLSSFACQYLPKTWSEWWSRTNAGGGTWKPVNFFRSLEKKTGSSLDRDSGFDSILSARDDEGGRLTGQLSRMVGGGETQSSCSWISGQREGGNGILAVWQKAALLWYAVGNVACGGTVAGNHHPPRKEIKKKQKKPQTKHCFLSDQEDVLRGGWSVELEAVQAQVWQTWLGSGCSLVPRVRCYCTADWSEWSEVKSGFAAVVGQGGAVCRGELWREDNCAQHLQSSRHKADISLLFCSLPWFCFVLAISSCTCTPAISVFCQWTCTMS